MLRLKKNDKNVNTLRSKIRYAVLIMNKEPLTKYTPVLRSSGDVYHIAAFLILNDLYDYDVFLRSNHILLRYISCPIDAHATKKQDGNLFYFFFLCIQNETQK